MKVKLIKEQTLRDYAEKAKQSRGPIRNWLTLLRVADWEQPSDMHRTFGVVDQLGQGTERVIFNLGGNKYRLICTYWFSTNWVYLYVKWIGTHKDYDALCRDNKQYHINDY